MNHKILGHTSVDPLISYCELCTELTLEGHSLWESRVWCARSLFFVRVELKNMNFKSISGKVQVKGWFQF